VSLQLQPPRKVTRIDRRGTRYYDVEGVGELASVTTILNVIAKPALIGWARNVALEKVRLTLMEQELAPSTEEEITRLIEVARKRPDEVRDTAANFGTAAHIAIDNYLAGLPYDSTSPEIEIVMENFREWQNESGFEIQMAEQVVYSEEHRYAGTFDAIGTRGDDLIVFDWKTSNGAYPEMGLQVAAYARAFTEMYKLPISEAWIIRISKDPPTTTPAFEALQVADIDKSFQSFLHALGLWRGMKQPQWNKG
jgi:hypothetical protein